MLHPLRRCLANLRALSACVAHAVGERAGPAAERARAVECRVRCGRSVSCPATPFGVGPRRVYRILTSYVWRGGALYLSSKAVYAGGGSFHFFENTKQNAFNQDLHRMHAVNSACCGTQCTVTERIGAFISISSPELTSNRTGQPAFALTPRLSRITQTESEKPTHDLDRPKVEAAKARRCRADTHNK